MKFDQIGAIGKGEKSPKIPFGAPSIVDLTPPRSKEAREKRELTRKWILIVIVIAVLVGVAIAGGLAMRFAAKSGYDSEVESQADVTAEIAEYSEVADALGAKTDLEAKRTKALQAQVKWSEALARVNSALPSGVFLEGYSALAGGSATTEGRMVIIAQVTSYQPIDYADVLVTFTGIESVTNVEIGDLTSQVEELESGGQRRKYSYPVAFAFDESFFVNQPEAPENPNSETEEN